MSKSRKHLAEIFFGDHRPSVVTAIAFVACLALLGDSASKLFEGQIYNLNPESIQNPKKFVKEGFSEVETKLHYPSSDFIGARLLCDFIETDKGVATTSPNKYSSYPTTVLIDSIGASSIFKIVAGGNLTEVPGMRGYEQNVWSSNMYFETEDGRVKVLTNSVGPTYFGDAMVNNQPSSRYFNLSPNHAVGGVIGGVDFALEETGNHNVYLGYDCDAGLTQTVLNTMNSN